MANRRFKQMQSLTLESGIVSLFGSLTIGAAGAIDSSSCKGFSVALTGSEDGRYTVTLEDTYHSLKAVNVTQIGATDAARTDASGIIVSVRNDDVNGAGTFHIQFSRNTTLADTDVTSGVVLLLQIVLKNSGLTF